MNCADEPNTTYLATDSLSEELLCSIPKKVYMWLNELGNSIDQEMGQTGNLKWDLISQTSTIQYGDPDDENEMYVQLWWEGEPLEPENIRTSSSNLEDISHNMDFFIKVEEAIYGELESLQANAE